MSKYEEFIYDFNDYLKSVSNAEKLETEIINLKSEFENYIMLCKGRTVSNKVEV